MLALAADLATMAEPEEAAGMVAAVKSEPGRFKAKRRQTTVPAGRLLAIARGYQHILERDPRKPEALVGMCVVALATRQAEAAVKMALAATDVSPGMAAAWAALGQALKAAGRLDEAEQAYGRAIRLDRMSAPARIGMGELKIAQGLPEEAMREFELAIRKGRATLAAQLGLGNALAMMGRNEEALERYESALALRPRLPEAEFAAGFALARLGRVQEAEKRYRRALVERPDFAAAWINLGSLLREQGQDVFAEAALKRATELRPDLVSGWVNLAILERERGKTEAAEAYLRRAFALNPDQVETLVAWCQFRAAEQDAAGAWGWLRWAMARNPQFDEAVNMHGILLHKEGRFSEAVQTFARAEALGSRAAASNRGNSLLDLGRMQEALRAHELAVERDASSAGAKYNLALVQLRLGDWERGWAGYEARLRFREVHRAPRIFKQPRWRGEELRGEHVLLHAEQGLGDTIQFCRYAALVAARGGVPILEVQPAAERLMRSLAVVRAGLAETAVLGAESSDPLAVIGGQQKPKPWQFAYECPLPSLPAVFGTTVETVPWVGAYLGGDAEMAAEKRARFANVGRGLRVGICWAGNPKYKADGARSMKLKTLLPLLCAVDATWISLQKGAAARQLAELPQDIFMWDGSSGDSDLAETAALVAGLDLVITTDTCIAHLAGAMAKPVWILLPHLADWRWMEETDTTPWYPTARLFRQSRPGDWAEVVQRATRSWMGKMLFTD